MYEPATYIARQSTRLKFEELRALILMGLVGISPNKNGD